MFAIDWDSMAPDDDWSDPPKIGLLRPPAEILAEILACSVLTTGKLHSREVVWRADGRDIVAGIAQPVHARLLMQLAEGGRSIDARAMDVAATILRDREAT